MRRNLELKQLAQYSRRPPCLLGALLLILGLGFLFVPPALSVYHGPAPDRSSPFVQWLARDLGTTPNKLTGRRLRQLTALHIPNLGEALNSLDGLELCSNLETLTIASQFV